MIAMVRHILFWKLREEIRAAGQAEYAEQVLAASVKTLLGIGNVSAIYQTDDTGNVLDAG